RFAEYRDGLLAGRRVLVPCGLVRPAVKPLAVVNGVVLVPVVKAVAAHHNDRSEQQSDHTRDEAALSHVVSPPVPPVYRANRRRFHEFLFVAAPAGAGRRAFWPLSGIGGASVPRAVPFVKGRRR